MEPRVSTKQFSNNTPFDAPYSEEELMLPVNIRIKPDFLPRNIIFNLETFEALKNFQMVMEGQIRRYTTDAEIIG
jgi:hypothetical protein